MKDTRQQLRETMDKLSLSLAKEVSRMKGDNALNVKTEVLKTLTAYLSMANREPQEAEGGDFAKWRTQIPGAGANGGGSAGGEQGDPDGGEGGESYDETPADEPTDDDPAEPHTEPAA